jgi:hypothetical protein
MVAMKAFMASASTRLEIHYPFPEDFERLSLFIYQGLLRKNY